MAHVPDESRSGFQGSKKRPLRLLVVMPSWVGDCVMATPTLAMLRDALPGAFIGALVRPGMDELLAGLRFFDELHVDRARGVMGPKLVAAKLRPRGYDTALLLTNSFSTALITRLAFIPRRVGYDRDARGLLLTDRLKPERRGPLASGFACVSAVDYYLRIGALTLHQDPPADAPRLELASTPDQDAASLALLDRAGLAPTDAFVLFNPGGNNPDKRWPADRFARAAAHAVSRHSVRVLVNGSPGEADLVDAIVAQARRELRAHAGDPCVVSLVRHGVTLGALKGVVRRARLMLTNDTGPRHIAAALAVPTVTLFGPTDPRWTTLPPSGAPMIDLLADPTLPPDQVADEHPDRCRIDRIGEPAVLGAMDSILGGFHAS